MKSSVQLILACSLLSTVSYGAALAPKPVEIKAAPRLEVKKGTPERAELLRDIKKIDPADRRLFLKLSTLNALEKPSEGDLVKTQKLERKGAEKKETLKDTVRPEKMRSEARMSVADLRSAETKLNTMGLQLKDGETAVDLKVGMDQILNGIVSMSRAEGDVKAQAAIQYKVLEAYVREINQPGRTFTAEENQIFSAALKQLYVNRYDPSSKEQKFGAMTYSEGEKASHFAVVAALARNLESGQDFTTAFKNAVKEVTKTQDENVLKKIMSDLEGCKI